jgi:hypothetical protein
MKLMKNTGWNGQNLTENNVEPPFPNIAILLYRHTDLDKIYHAISEIMVSIQQNNARKFSKIRPKSV